MFKLVRAVVKVSSIFESGSLAEDAAQSNAGPVNI